MKVVTSEQMRELDRKTISDYATPGEILMDRAGMAVADAAKYLAEVSGFEDCPVRLFAGRGNNGGDAFAAARHLKDRGLEVEVWLACEAESVSGDALKHLSKMKSAGIAPRALATKWDWEDALAADFERAGEILVDGVLGIGITGPARGPAAGAISYINALSRRNLVVSIDVPSGLNADTGAAEGDAVVADITVTIGLPKRGLMEPRAVNYVGSLEVADIGIPPELVANVESDMELITMRDLRGLIARRRRDAHKGMFGRLLILGGAAGYSGAIAIATRAALRSGVGLVTALVPKSVAPIVAGLVPEAMVHPAAETAAGSLSADCLAEWGRQHNSGAGMTARGLNDFDAVLIGPGMTDSDDSRLLVEKILAECRKPLVLDADALNVCAGRPGLIKSSAAQIIITPHPGEMARLMGTDAAGVQADRFRWARRAAEETNAVVVLKGAGTVVAAIGQPLNVNLNGNPGMATGGMGDALAGLVAGLAAQNIAPFDAARMGVCVHGKAGDYAAWRGSQAGMLAGDLIAELPMVFKELTHR